LGEVAIEWKELAKARNQGSRDTGFWQAVENLLWLDRLSSDLEAYGGEKSVEVVGDTLIEAVQLTPFVLGEMAIAGKGLEKTSGERSIDTLE
jgi:hypothetical protein